jgi:hypothetical protein
VGEGRSRLGIGRFAWWLVCRSKLHGFVQFAELGARLQIPRFSVRAMCSAARLIRGHAAGAGRRVFCGYTPY